MQSNGVVIKHILLQLVLGYSPSSASPGTQPPVSD